MPNRMGRHWIWLENEYSLRHDLIDIFLCTVIVFDDEAVGD